MEKNIIKIGFGNRHLYAEQVGENPNDLWSYMPMVEAASNKTKNGA